MCLTPGRPVKIRDPLRPLAGLFSVVSGGGRSNVSSFAARSKHSYLPDVGFPPRL